MEALDRSKGHALTAEEPSGRRHAHRRLGLHKELPAQKTAPDDAMARTFHGQSERNDSITSTSDRSQLYRKRGRARGPLAYMGHAVMENSNGLAVDGTVRRPAAPPSGVLERVLKKKPKRSGRKNHGRLDKAYIPAIPLRRGDEHHTDVAQNTARPDGSIAAETIDGRTTAKSVTESTVVPRDERGHLRLGQAALATLRKEYNAPRIAVVVPIPAQSHRPTISCAIPKIMAA